VRQLNAADFAILSPDASGGGLKAGLTGGIAVGKTFVVSVLRELGCQVIDADLLAHQAIEPGKPAYQEIIREFGQEVVAESGEIDRARLGAMVFAEPGLRAKLNGIVHPRVFEAQAKWLAEVEARSPGAIAIVDAALLIETGAYKRFEKVIVVYCAPELQLERLMRRDNLSRQDAQARIASQMPSEEKLKFADYSIDTSGSFAETRLRVEAVYASLIRLR
jgi:dephospho-CoA kinase